MDGVILNDILNRKKRKEKIMDGILKDKWMDAWTDGEILKDI